MPSLEDLKKRIYHSKVENELNNRLEYQPEIDNTPPPTPKSFLSPFLKKWLKMGLGLLFAIILIVSVVSIIRKNVSFSQDNVSIKLEGSQKIESGEFLKYDFVIKNSNGAGLTNVRLIVEYPLNSKIQNPERPDNQDIINIDHINGRSEKTVSSYVRIFGPEDSKKIIKTKLEYIPARISSKLEKTMDFAVDIVSSPIKIIIDEPKIITINKDLTYGILITNQSADSYQNLRINIDYPDGFVVTKILPNNPNIGNHTWQIDKLMPGEERELKITGKLTKKTDIVNLVVSIQLKGDKGQYQTYAQSFSATFPTPPPISVSIQSTNLMVPNIVNPGVKEVGFVINFQNTTDSILRDIVLTVTLNGNIYDPNSVIPNNQGAYLKENKTIMWDSRRIPQLAILEPFETGSARFTLNIKKILNIQNYNDKNFILRVSADIQPNNIPTELSGIEIKDSAETYLKLNSILSLTEQILPQDTTNPFSNSGPFPPKIGEKTTYLIALRLINYYNDLKNISVSTVLPQGIDWENTVWPASSNVTFDPLTGKILWQFDSLRAGTGITSPVEQIIFKVSSIPSPTLKGDGIVLLEETKARATDLFTNQVLSSKFRELKTVAVK